MALAVCIGQPYAVEGRNGWCSGHNPAQQTRYPIPGYGDSRRCNATRRGCWAHRPRPSLISAASLKGPSSWPLTGPHATCLAVQPV